MVGSDRDGPGDEREIIFQFNMGYTLFELILLTGRGRAEEYFISLFSSYRTYSDSLVSLSRCYLKTSLW